MENELETTKFQGPYNPRYNNRLGRILGGLVIVMAGSAILMQRAGVYFPGWVFSFEMFLVTLGLYLWARHSFRRPGGLILMLVGGFLLLDNIIPDLRVGPYVWPIIIIGVGIYMIVSPGGFARRKSMMQKFGRKDENPDLKNASSEEFLNVTSVFAGIKKRFFTKDFKGGKAVCFMGGIEVDLGNADIQQPVTIEVSQVFGGTKLIIPSNWQVRSEIVAIAGGVEDKRHQPALMEEADTEKVLIIRGTIIFGGIDIKSY
ncbi:MAG: LiaF domain-containing protein [Bacteroidia bacterium]